MRNRIMISCVALLLVRCSHKPDQLSINEGRFNTSRLSEVRGISKFFCQTADSGYQLVFKKESYDHLNNDEKLEIESNCAFKCVRVIVDDHYVSRGREDRSTFCAFWIETTNDKITTFGLYYPSSWQFIAGPSYEYGIKYVNGVPVVDSLVGKGWVD